MRQLYSMLLFVYSAGVQKISGNQLGKASNIRGDYTVHSHKKQVVCYWGTWANYRPTDGKFTPEHIDPDLCTHLIYSFAGLDTTSWSMKTLDPWMDLEDNYGLAGFKKATDLKYSNPHLKVTLAIGGWNEGSEKYSEMAKDPIRRRSFVNSALAFIKQYNFDGLDLDWEYPGKRGGKPEDKANFIELIKELHLVFSKEKLLLTAAIGASADTIDAAYDVPAMYRYLDFVHVMCYDYHGKWDEKTGHNAPLSFAPTEKAMDLALNLNYSIAYLLKKGAIPEKTVIGVPLYGRAFSLKNPNSNRVGAPSKTTSFQGPYTREDGFLGYNEICLEAQDDQSPWTLSWDNEQHVPYMFRGDSWISYDNEKSLRIKADFAYDLELAGVMTWSIDTDDFLGLCNGPKFPMLRTLNNALYQRTHRISASTAPAVSVTAFIGVLAIVLLRR